MKFWQFLCVLALAVYLLPSQGTDIGELIPVELLYLKWEESAVEVETDTGQKGKGATLESAMIDLQESASGKMFLESAENLIMTEPNEADLEALTSWVRPSIKAITSRARINPEKAAAYLRAHPPKTTLGNVLKGISVLPELEAGEQQMKLYEE